VPCVAGTVFSPVLVASLTSGQGLHALHPINREFTRLVVEIVDEVLDPLDKEDRDEPEETCS
jgi:hypothetical protein